MSRIAILFLITAAFAFTGCEEFKSPVRSGDSNCHTGLAQIGIGDGFIEYLCGCTGQPVGGTILYSPATVTCHVPAGTTVMFQYIGIHTKHQIINSSGLQFPSGAPVDGTNVYVTPAPTLTTPGTYGFSDAFNNGITGQLIVP